MEIKMKKLLLLLFALIMSCALLTACNDGSADGSGGADHTHEFVLTSSGTPTCTEAAKDTYTCSCGATEEREGAAATGHGFELTAEGTPTCTESAVDVYTCHCGATEEREGAEASHNFVIMKKGTASCEKDATDYYKCTVCGKMESRPGAEAIGHNYIDKGVREPTCTQTGAYLKSCTNCGATDNTPIPALGHEYSTNVYESSRLVPCIRKGCSYGLVQAGDGKYTEILVYTFSDEDKADIDQIHSDVLAAIDAAELYDAALHGFAESGELAEAYKEFEALYEQYYKLVEYVVSQYQIAQIEYHLDMSNEEKKATFQYISDYRTELISKFYSFSEPIYNSKYREFYYEGMTEEEIMAFIFDSNAVSNPEYKALSDRNTEIELAFDEISDPASSDQVPLLYAEFVENNKKIAELLGYDNYLEYAYENVYDRDYTYQDVEQIAEYVKQYITQPYSSIYSKWMALMSGEGLDISAYYNEFYPLAAESFFETIKSNTLLNDYIDSGLEFTSDPEKQISFSDEFNGLFENGNLFRGEYQGAYVTSLANLPGSVSAIPIAYFGPGYDSASTVAHEFGHYMNEVYNADVSGQSYDLLEMHSQGNEMLFLAYLDGKISDSGFDLYETYSMLVITDTIIAALCVDTFENAVYTGRYEGTESETIMADGVISADEYDLLYRSILADFGVQSYQSSTYWRYMTIKSPCYYVSYSVSALSVLQLYADARNDGYESARDSYLKLFTYTDENEEMTAEEVLIYAGLDSFTSEELYIKLSALLKSIN